MSTLLRRSDRRSRFTLILTWVVLFSMTTTFFPPVNAVQAQTNSDLALWLKFDEAAGTTTFADASGNNITASCTGNACPVMGGTGRLGQAAQFDGADDKVNVTLNVPAGSFSLAAWVNHTGATLGGWRTVMEFGDDAPWFGVNDSGQLSLYPTIAGGSLPLGQWVHVAYVWNGSEGRLYINGQAVQTNNTAPTVTGQGLGIGSELSFPSPWQGLIDDVRVYSKALSAVEVGELAKPEAGPAPQPAPPPVDTGNARLVDLTVSLYKSATTAEERKPYEDLFRLYADAIYEMTNGTHKVRNVTIYDNGRFADRANIQWIAFEKQPRASVSAYGKGRGTVYMGDAIFDQNTLITNPEQMPVFVQTLAHEWGHYFYGVGDEYTQQAGDQLPEPCSVMCAAGGPLDYSKLNFSTRKSTVLAGRTANPHYREYGASGWETLVRSPNDDPAPVRGQRLYWPDLIPVAPAADADPSVELPANQAAARSALNITWADANLTARKYRVLLVDVSADMADNNKLASAKVALKNYVDTANINDRIGIITFADTHTVVQALTAIDGEATKTTIKAQIDTITAKAGVNDRNVAAADQAAITALKNAPDFGLITDRGVYTIIDGGFTDTTEPHIFQKLYNDHSSAGIPLSVFNFAAEKKPNDPFGNALDLMQFSTTAANPPGTYQFVGTGGFTLPTRYGQQRRMTANPADADKLLNAMNSVDQSASAIVDINLGSSQDEAVEAGTPFAASFYVDSTLDAIEIYVSHSGAPDEGQVTLFDPGGNEVVDNDIYGDDEDTLYVFYATAPITGNWELEVSAVSSPIVTSFDAIGYTSSGETIQAILTAEGGNIVNYPNEVVLVASLSGAQAIAKANHFAWVEGPDGTFSAITFTDDGVAPDQLANDGLYSALMPYNLPGDYYITIVFDNNAGTAVYSQAGEADGANDFVAVPFDFERDASLQVLVQDYAADDHGADDATASDMLPNNGDNAGRIDNAGDKDRFRITSPTPDTSGPKSLANTQAAALTQISETTRYALRLTHFAFGMNATVRVTIGGVTKTYETGPLNYNEYWSVPVDLAPGEVVYVEVSHNNTQVTAGSYDISFGKPLPGEFPNDMIYLPLVSR